MGLLPAWTWYGGRDTQLSETIQPYKIPTVTDSIMGVRFEVGKFAFFDQYHR